MPCRGIRAVSDSRGRRLTYGTAIGGVVGEPAVYTVSRMREQLAALILDGQYHLVADLVPVSTLRVARRTQRLHLDQTRLIGRQRSHVTRFSPAPPRREHLARSGCSCAARRR